MDHQTTHPPGSASLRLRDFAAELFAAFEAKVPGRRPRPGSAATIGNPGFFSWRNDAFDGDFTGMYRLLGHFMG